MKKTHNILIIVDAQNDFIDGALANKEAQEAVPRIIELINSQKWDAIYATQDTHYTNYLQTKEGIALPIKHCIINTKGWQINNSIIKAITESNSHCFNLVYKPTFGSNDLCNRIVNTLNLDCGEELKITFVGFCTDICVISNVLMTKANFPYTADIYVKADCCAGVTPETHEAALTVMKSCQINII